MTTSIYAKTIILLLIVAAVLAKSAESDNYLRGQRGSSSAADYFNTRLQESNGVVSLGESSGIYLSLGDVGTYGIQVAL